MFIQGVFFNWDPLKVLIVFLGDEGKLSYKKTVKIKKFFERGGFPY